MARSTDPTASPISAISEPDRVININVEGSRSLQRAGNVLDKHRRNFLQDSARLGAFALTGGRSGVSILLSRKAGRGANSI